MQQIDGAWTSFVAAQAPAGSAWTEVDDVDTTSYFGNNGVPCFGSGNIQGDPAFQYVGALLHCDAIFESTFVNSVPSGAAISMSGTILSTTRSPFGAYPNSAETDFGVINVGSGAGMNFS